MEANLQGPSWRASQAFCAACTACALSPSSVAMLRSRSEPRLSCAGIAAPAWRPQCRCRCQLQPFCRLRLLHASAASEPVACSMRRRGCLAGALSGRVRGRPSKASGVVDLWQASSHRPAGPIDLQVQYVGARYEGCCYRCSQPLRIHPLYGLHTRAASQPALQCGVAPRAHTGDLAGYFVSLAGCHEGHYASGNTRTGESCSRKPEGVLRTEAPLACEAPAAIPRRTGLARSVLTRLS